MFSINEVNDIIEELKNSKYCYVSEAHIQLQFAIVSNNLFKNASEFVPEYPGITNIAGVDKKTEFDLLVVDKETQEKTLIEFKYKTRNATDKSKRTLFPTYLGTDIALANHSAHDLNRYDCWWDIYRIESNVKSGTFTNGFFIFVTNEYLYKDEDGSAILSYKNDPEMFSLKKGYHKAMVKTVDNKLDPKTAGAFRINNPIHIKNDYVFEYNKFQDFRLPKNGEFWSLIVPIEE